MNKTNKYNIYIIDDHAIVREGLTVMLNHEPDMVVSGAAEDGSTAIKEIKEINPDIAIVDLSLADSEGLEVINSITHCYPDIQILVLSMREEYIFAERCIKAGASGYVMKSEQPSIIIDAIREVMKGKIYLTQRMIEYVLNKTLNVKKRQDIDDVDILSNREFQVFQMIGNGLTSKQIAEMLELSVKTINAIRENIKHKLALKSSTEVVQYAIKWARHHDTTL